MAKDSNFVNNGVRMTFINEKFLTTVIKMLSSSYDIKKRILVNLQTLFKIIDKPYYTKDMTLHALIFSSELILRLRMIDSVDKDTIITEIQMGILDAYNDIKENILFPAIMAADSVTEREIKFIEKTLETALKYGSIITKKDLLSDIITDISSGNVFHLDESLKTFRTLIAGINEDFKKAELENQKISMVDTHTEDYVSTTLLEAYKYSKSPKMVLKTGLQTFNNMLSEEGGFLSGKYYMFYASINSFKSALLMYISKWIQKYNSENFLEEFLVTKKRPTVLYVSLENVEIEDTIRLFTMYTGRDIKECNNFMEARDMWSKSIYENNSIIAIKQVHAEPQTTTWTDIKGIVERVEEEENCKIIALLVDYIELIAVEPEKKKMERRDQLGDISVNMHLFAGTKQIPVISCQQMNRAGAQALAEIYEKGVANAIRSMGRQYIGEAYSIDKPTDFSGFIGVERSIYDNKFYLTVKREKVRYKRTSTDYFVHELKGGFIIQDDLGLEKTLSKPMIMAESMDDLSFHISKTNGSGKIGSRGMTDIRDKEDKPVVKEVSKEIRKEISVLDLVEAAKYKWLNNFDTIDVEIAYDMENETVFDHVDLNGERKVLVEDGNYIIMNNVEYMEEYV